MKKNTKLYLKPIISYLCFFIFAILVKCVDRQEITKGNTTEVGFAALNKALTPSKFSEFFYKFSEILGYLCIALCLYFAFIGIVQLAKRKNLLKVDYRIIALGIFYLVVIIFYLLFNLIPINLRPSGDFEQSFPSSHTVLALCVMISGVRYFAAKIKDEQKLKIIKIVCYTIGGLTVLTRFISGAHWFTDIIGALVLTWAHINLHNALTKHIGRLYKQAKKEQNTQIAEVTDDN